MSRTRLPIGRALGVFLTVTLAASGTASAHQVGGTRFQTPIPLWLLFGGAAATVGLTAVGLAVGGSRPTVSAADTTASAADTTAPDAEATAASRRVLRIPTPVGDAAATLARVGFLALVSLAIVAGFVGPQTPARNVATLFVWAVWLKGVGILAAVVGDPWPVLSPWRTVYEGLARIEGEEISIMTYPERLGEWPALIGVLAWVGIAENLTVLPRSPAGTAVVVLGYAITMLAGGLVFGRAWFRRADALAVLYRLFGRVAPLDVRRTEDGYRVGLRPPWRGCTAPARSLGGVAVAVAAVYTVSFDAFTGTPEYRSILFSLRDATGLGPQASVLLYLAGVVLFVGAFVGVAALTTRLSNSAATAAGWRPAALALAPTLLPIAVAYEIGHNYPYVLGTLGQLVGVLAGYVTSSAPTLTPLSWLSVQGFWASQVVLIVAGHLVAVVAAHAVVVEYAPAARSAIRVHAPLAALMVAYTVVSLWTISRPVVA
ncbi:hypothetical protein SAMN06269185_0367 [Natronoarchaeum philippinense]|uniref:Uncharacterized protein n=1 Tax=Natronoarchaeum philippinense TaxID=558529 RepID=A0A285N380_NATPI|nr:hypothetical protein [Natronoarchaeum philippinense]SNZ03778.1 hypothetical protein SAMN06269185_0367 [Natronoarchaeum philippinense]